jgi:hypothetical protein
MVDIAQHKEGHIAGQRPYTLLSLKLDLDLRGYLEDLGLILGILAIMVSSIWKPLEKEADSFVQFEKFIDSCREKQFPILDSDLLLRKGPFGSISKAL